MGCCGSASSLNVSPQRSVKAQGEEISDALSTGKALGEQFGDAVSSTKPHHEHLCRPGSKYDAPELTMLMACETREMPKLMVSEPTPLRGCTSETPVATPNSCGTLVRQDGSLVSFTMEEQVRDKIMFLTPKVAGSEHKNEFMRWSCEKQAWEPLCVTPTFSPGMHVDHGPSAGAATKNPADEQDSPTTAEQSIATRVGHLLTSYFAWMGEKEERKL